MTVPDKFVTLSNGLLKSSSKEANNLRTDHWVMDKNTLRTSSLWALENMP